MLTKDQADAASDALMGEAKEQQIANEIILRKKRNRSRMPPIKWLIIGAVVGLIVGGFAEYLFAGTITFWSIIGLALGMGVGIALDSRVEA